MQEERKMILKMIEDGKITAEEGLQLLNALKEGKENSTTAAEEKTTEQLSKDVDWENSQNNYYEKTSKKSSFANRFSEFIEEAVQKIKEFDLDFNFGSSVEIQHIFQHKGENVRNVDVHLENGSITFRPWEEEDIRVECNVKVYKVHDNDEARKFFLDEVNFDVSNERLRFESNRKTMKINTVIYVPKENLEKVKLYTFNGKVDGETVQSEKFEAQTVNGRINFDEVDAKDVRFETVNGTISISKLNMEHTDAKTVNGTMSLNVVKGKLDAETLNGTVHYTLLEPTNSRAYIKTTTGSVNVIVPEEVKTEGELKTTVGGIHCDLDHLSIIEEKKEFASKKMSFLANKEGENAFYVEVEATTGSITVKH
ncbi:DUF4097 family beta strand repeat-containing protein [Evansella cellulosilytica]|uniref:Uncharacterized protein n=1 Tax=Evansella cellulosilytica (strain ATCC 21833 / DSM 2522 / FERM P-1141 / JCM 9156 / N-4) TaxID=649639 RepID=E6TRI8_EVAC2|nr:DUF4097 domain-containing protein [Evansella cellulosilytica]ADU31818.1 Protein of unknown function DUF2089 [Evansella cellulosilytica DSM 2522]